MPEAHPAQEAYQYRTPVAVQAVDREAAQLPSAVTIAGDAEGALDAVGALEGVTFWQGKAEVQRRDARVDGVGSDDRDVAHVDFRAALGDQYRPVRALYGSPVCFVQQLTSVVQREARQVGPEYTGVVDQASAEVQLDSREVVAVGVQRRDIAPLEHTIHSDFQSAALFKGGRGCDADCF